LAALRRLQECEHPASLLADLLRRDATLNRQDILPGTSADLSVATLLVQKLQSLLRSEAVAC
jgi:triphosphoribosyl-dephospho-CoA synthetase